MKDLKTLDHADIDDDRQKMQAEAKLTQLFTEFLHNYDFRSLNLYWCYIYFSLGHVTGKHLYGPGMGNNS